MSDRKTWGYMAELEEMRVGDRFYYPTTEHTWQADRKRLARSPAQRPPHLKDYVFSVNLIRGTQHFGDEVHYLICVERTA